MRCTRTSIKPVEGINKYTHKFSCYWVVVLRICGAIIMVFHLRFGLFLENIKALEVQQKIKILLI
jgi:hypothetical protein